LFPLQRLSVAFLRLTASSRPSAPPSGSPKSLRFGHWLTLCTPNIHLLTYLLTYLMGYRWGEWCANGWRRRCVSHGGRQLRATT